jgi:hypothetical protein
MQVMWLNIILWTQENKTRTQPNLCHDIRFLDLALLINVKIKMFHLTDWGLTFFMISSLKLNLS